MRPPLGEDGSVQITGRVAALARPTEILVSRTVRDLLTGSDICFIERGSHDLNDAGGGPWPLFAVATVTMADAAGSQDSARL
jgi:class 3 adenylate cyclase